MLGFMYETSSLDDKTAEILRKDVWIRKLQCCLVERALRHLRALFKWRIKKLFFETGEMKVSWKLPWACAKELEGYLWVTWNVSYMQCSRI